MNDEADHKYKEFMQAGAEALKNNDWVKAKDAYEKALMIHQDNEVVWGNVGYCYDELGDLRTALGCYNKALEYNPMHKYTLLNKGNLLARHKQYKEALQCFERAYQADHDLDVALQNRTSVLEEMVKEGLIQVVRPHEMEVVQKAGQFYLMVGDNPIKTPSGQVIGSKTTGVFDRMVKDFENQGEDILVENGIIIEPRAIGAYVFESSRLDFFEKGDRFTNLPAWIMHDPVFSPTAGHPITSQFQEGRQECVRSFLKEHGYSLAVWDRYSNDQIKEIIQIFLKVAMGFTTAQQSVLINLSWPNGGQFVITMMYLLGRCNEREWATTIFSRSADVCRLIGDEPIAWNMSTPDDLSDEEREELIEAIILNYEYNIKIAKYYLEASREKAV